MKTASLALALSLLSVSTSSGTPALAHTLPAATHQAQNAPESASPDGLGDSMRRYLCRFVDWC
ncbi:hypothetical protein [Arthrobacter sp. 260]|uniref:hypothetical protein n=1 Tax=Arthrobacter sp. 260 TaxID=2735314 RepID=UPI001492F24A|nr:hypothetical protein [Arthrobacter sp. 260]NOJ58886.1 hypothetical protein [Arthrobacter sp. 260]